MPRLKYFLLFAALIIFLSFEFIRCSSVFKDEVITSPYKNLNDSVRYVGMQTCRTCHENVYQTFIETGMGQSWNHATKKKSSARFDSHAYVYDAFKNFWYHPIWKNDSLFLNEFRLEGTDTVFSRTEKISYIVGSGQHTNSHIWMQNGFLQQAPLTYYTQKGIWGLPPGFEDGENTRWSRTISIECMNCHNMYPEFDTTSENKFITVKTGIECERCHGAGGEHVKEKLAGIFIDTSKAIDYSIVNPKKLSRELQVELCQRCHMQGISVLNEGKTFYDFKPGMKLNEVMNVFMPRYENDPPKFIMASHADRMKQSKCYLNSDLTCLTCHNPHVSVKFTSADKFNNACVVCHSSPKVECKLPFQERAVEENNCYKCHMPVSQTIDIPNVTVHDHRIQIPVTRNDKEEIMKFIKLECLTTTHPSNLLMAQGYLQTFEGFSSQSFLLDSAKKNIDQIKDKSESEVVQTLIRYFYLKNNFQDVINIAKEKIKVKTEKDVWTLYRVGEAFYQTGDYADAEIFFSKAIEMNGHNLEFLNKEGSALMALNKLDSAQKIFRKCVDLNPDFAPAQNNLGYTYLLRADYDYAEKLFEKALALDPDYEQALMNKAAVCSVKGNNKEARFFLLRVLKINPDNSKAKLALRQVAL